MSALLAFSRSARRAIRYRAVALGGLVTSFLLWLPEAGSAAIILTDENNYVGVPTASFWVLIVAVTGMFITAGLTWRFTRTWSERRRRRRACPPAKKEKRRAVAGPPWVG